MNVHLYPKVNDEKLCSFCKGSLGSADLTSQDEWSGRTVLLSVILRCESVKLDNVVYCWFYGHRYDMKLANFLNLNFTYWSHLDRFLVKI